MYPAPILIARTYNDSVRKSHLIRRHKTNTPIAVRIQREGEVVGYNPYIVSPKLIRAVAPPLHAPRACYARANNSDSRLNISRAAFIAGKKALLIKCALTRAARIYSRSQSDTRAVRRNAPLSRPHNKGCECLPALYSQFSWHDRD